MASLDFVPGTVVPVDSVLPALESRRRRRKKPQKQAPVSALHPPDLARVGEAPVLAGAALVEGASVEGALAPEDLRRKILRKSLKQRSPLRVGPGALDHAGDALDPVGRVLVDSVGDHGGRREKSHRKSPRQRSRRQRSPLHPVLEVLAPEAGASVPEGRVLVGEDSAPEDLRRKHHQRSRRQRSLLRKEALRALVLSGRKGGSVLDLMVPNNRRKNLLLPKRSHPGLTDFPGEAGAAGQRANDRAGEALDLPAVVKVPPYGEGDSPPVAQVASLAEVDPQRGLSPFDDLGPCRDAFHSERNPLALVAISHGAVVALRVARDLEDQVASPEWLEVGASGDPVLLGALGDPSLAAVVGTLVGDRCGAEGDSAEVDPG